MSFTPEERFRQTTLFRRKADLVRSKGMAVSVPGVMMRAVLEELDALRAIADPDDPRVKQRHDAEMAQLCADHKEELAALRGERDRALIERDASKDVAAAAVAAAKNGHAPAEVPKTRAPRTKEEPWRSICFAANDILTGGDDDGLMDLWGEPLPVALVSWGEVTGTDVKAWVKALASVVPSAAGPSPAKERKAAV